MNNVIGAVLVSVLLTGFASAQTNAPVVAPPVKDLKVAETIAPLMQSEKGKQLREAVMAAQDNYNKAEAAVPEIKELDARIAVLMEQLRALRTTRMELSKNSPVLADKRAALDAARKAFYDEVRKLFPVPKVDN